ncbi:suppressor of fused domain protein [Tundrisphaera lichenicola]|uniref:suppressor of fused domain protein n=1 Tax=Tundrisphaera lichenicola TaxID=2029860 RepID=UPI003EB8F02D
MSSPSWQDWFEGAWADREENIYPERFGSDQRGIFTLSHDIFLETFQQPSFDPRWLFYGVFEYSPTATRSSWLYVTSGMSNAWEDDEPRADGPSGFGCEFVLETVEQGDWAILRLQHLMAFQILLAHGRYPGRDPIEPYDRIPLRASITPESSELRWLILALPVSFDPNFRLSSGWVELYQVFGATEEESAYAREHGGDDLVRLLTQAGEYPVTNPRRKSVVGPA